MKRLFTLMAALMLTVTASFAQHNFYFWGKDGNVSIEPVSEVDSLTFSVGNWLFQISKPVKRSTTSVAFSGSAKVAVNDKVKSIDVTPEVGICYSDKNHTPTYNDFKEKLDSAMKDHSFTIKNLTPGTTYYFRTYVKLLNEIYYSAVNSVTTWTIINGHEFVDLGLPSGLLWANTNIGASTSDDDGYYFAWGDKTSDTCFDWGTYKWSNDKRTEITKYNSSDGKITLDADDDAATYWWDAPCRMPDVSEFEELYNNCDWSWHRYGYIVTGPNGNTILLPAAGYRYYGSLGNSSRGYYWTRSLYWPENLKARFLYFDRDNVDPAKCGERCYGLPIRPVAEK